MKIRKIHIVAGLLIIGAIVLLISASKDMSTYSTFAQAAAGNTDVKIVGQLAKEKEMHYDPIKDPNYFSFYMTDADGEEKKVIFLSKKPQDFELSEQIVVTGNMKDDVFVAKDMLMKCPSKYKDEEIYIKSEQTSSI